MDVGHPLGTGEGLGLGDASVGVGQVGVGEGVVGLLLGLGAVVDGSGLGAVVDGSGLGALWVGSDVGVAGGADVGSEGDGRVDVAGAVLVSPPDPEDVGVPSTGAAEGGAVSVVLPASGGTSTVPGGSGVPGGGIGPAIGTSRTTVPPSAPRSFPFAGPRVPTRGLRRTGFPVA